MFPFVHHPCNSVHQHLTTGGRFHIMSFETTTHSPSDSSYVVERNGTVTGLEQIPYTVLATAGARVYHTKLTDKDDQWTYSRWKGSLSFCRDIDNPISLSRGAGEVEKHWFRLADENTGRTVWMFRLPEQFEYKIDRPFFHVFQGRVSHQVSSCPNR